MASGTTFHFEGKRALVTGAGRGTLMVRIILLIKRMCYNCYPEKNDLTAIILLKLGLLKRFVLQAVSEVQHLVSPSTA